MLTSSIIKIKELVSINSYWAWNIYEHDKKKLEAFKMWCYRRMMKISWRDHITNQEVLQRIEEKRSLITTISIRRAKWLGHILRQDGLLLNIIEGAVEGMQEADKGRNIWTTSSTN